jgi:hypothetical protein
MSPPPLAAGPMLTITCAPFMVETTLGSATSRRPHGRLEVSRALALSNRTPETSMGLVPRKGNSPVPATKEAAMGTTEAEVRRRIAARKDEPRQTESDQGARDKLDLEEARLVDESTRRSMEGTVAGQRALQDQAATTALARKAPGDQGSPHGTGLDTRLANDPDRIADERRRAIGKAEAKKGPSPDETVHIPRAVRKGSKARKGKAHARA